MEIFGRMDLWKMCQVGGDVAQPVDSTLQRQM